MREENPICVYPGCHKPWDDGHEIVTRARGGSPIEASNVVGLCRPHHSWVTDHPKLAHEIGLMKHGWEAT